MYPDTFLTHRSHIYLHLPQWASMAQWHSTVQLCLRSCDCASCRWLVYWMLLYGRCLHWSAQYVTLARSLPPLIETFSRNPHAGVYNTARPQQGDLHNKSIHYITIYSQDGSTYPVRNELTRAQYPVENKREELIREENRTQCKE